MFGIGTALGPSLGGVMIAGLGWRAIFFFKVPLGFMTFLLGYRYLPFDQLRQKTELTVFDKAGTMLLAATLAAYTLAMTIGRGHFDSLNLALLLAAIFGVGLFIFIEMKVASPLIRLGIFRDQVLGASLSMNTIVSTLMMATLVVGPFYLSQGLGLETWLVGVALSAGPLIVALTGFPAGRLVDRFGSGYITIIGLVGIAAGSFTLSMMPAIFGISGYLAPIVLITSGYALFQAANNTAVMTGIQPDQRGVVSGMLSLSRNLGLITGASVMGAVFAAASGMTDISDASSDAIATGMQITFAVAGVLSVVALMIAIVSRATLRRAVSPNLKQECAVILNASSAVDSR